MMYSNLGQTNSLGQVSGMLKTESNFLVFVFSIDSVWDLA